MILSSLSSTTIATGLFCTSDSKYCFSRASSSAFRLYSVMSRATQITESDVIGETRAENHVFLPLRSKLYSTLVNSPVVNVRRMLLRKKAA